MMVPNLEQMMTTQSFETDQGAGLEEELHDVRIKKHFGNGTGVHSFNLEFLLAPSETKQVSFQPSLWKDRKGMGCAGKAVNHSIFHARIATKAT